jgi:three-Cys-motif partner protein
MYQHLETWAPCLVLLDPEGTELAWKTVEAVAAFKTGKTKAELLILLPTHMGFLRMLPTENDEAIQPDKIDSMFGTDEWREIWSDKRKFWLTPKQATDRYVELYAEQLRRLGYAQVLSRVIKTRGQIGRPMYHLLFATDHAAGVKIMDHCFSTVYEAMDLRLFDM